MQLTKNMVRHRPQIHMFHRTKSKPDVFVQVLMNDVNKEKRFLSLRQMIKVEQTAEADADAGLLPKHAQFASGERLSTFYADHAHRSGTCQFHRRSHLPTNEIQKQ